MDYIFRRLALDFLPYERRAELGIFTARERAAQAKAEMAGEDVDLAALAASAPIERPSLPQAPAEKPPMPSSVELLEQVQHRETDAPLCFTCGTKMRPAGSCYVCEGCGSTSGCS